MSQANENRPPDTAEPVAAGAPGAADAADTDPTAAPLSLEEQLKQALDKAQEREDAWLRAKAETENMRRRAQEDVTKAHKFAVESLASQLLPVRDSLVTAAGGRILSVPAREDLHHSQTPQAYRLAALAEAIGQAMAEGREEATAFAPLLRAGARVEAVPGEAANLKITYAGDLALLESGEAT